MKFSGICLVTESVPALVQFYTKIFGCQATGDDFHAEIEIGGLSLAIFNSQGMEEMAPGSMQGAGCGSFTIGFEVEDVDAEYERLIALGATIVKPPATYPWGARSAWFRDPDGNLIDFYSKVDP
jgi:catechol 2,3-dioxygenase-like lactoylglutathione lyase family enzyme